MKLKTKAMAFTLAALMTMSSVNVLAGTGTLVKNDKKNPVHFSELGMDYEINEKGIYEVNIKRNKAVKLAENSIKNAVQIDISHINSAYGIKIITRASWYKGYDIEVSLSSGAVLNIGSDVIDYILQYHESDEIEIYFDCYGKVEILADGEELGILPANMTMTLKMPFDFKENFREDNTVMREEGGKAIARSWYENGFVIAKISGNGVYGPVYIEGGVFIDTQGNWAEDAIRYVHARGLMAPEVYVFFWPEESVGITEYTEILEKVFAVDIEVGGPVEEKETQRYPVYIFTYKVLEFAGFDLEAYDGDFEDFYLVNEDGRYMVAALAGEGMVQGDDGYLDVYETMTREEIAQLLYDMFKNINE